MRTKLTWMILASGTFLAAAPSHAQTYDPNFPVCLQVYRAQRRIYRLQFHLTAAVPGDGFWPRSSMLCQPILRVCQKPRDPLTDTGGLTRRR